jgi:hypothetical protein
MKQVKNRILQHLTREAAMTKSEEKKGLASPYELNRRPKRPYHKPTVHFERVFEVQALMCGKIQATSGSCHALRKTS